jgi:hypothetical protein
MEPGASKLAGGPDSVLTLRSGAGVQSWRPSEDGWCGVDPDRADGSAVVLVDDDERVRGGAAASAQWSMRHVPRSSL